MSHHAIHRRTAAAFAATALLLAGCIDAETLREARHKASQGAQFAEVDLGAFSIALPHKPGEANHGAIDFHAFGEVTRNERDELTALLASHAPELRAKMLLAIRSLPPQQYEDPGLDALRAGIAQVVNDVAEKRLVNSVGFYRYSPAAH
jgi:hypothetical protein